MSLGFWEEKNAMLLNGATAHAIVSAIHLAWTNNDIPRLLDLFAPDMLYRCNLPDETGNARCIEGRDAFGEFLRFKRTLMDSSTVVDRFSYSSGIARAYVSYFQRHHTTRLEYSGSYRQIAMFRDMKVVLLEEFHDVQKLRAFWKLVEAEENL
jgi:ketosteroid isomerase-like protein